MFLVGIALELFMIVAAGTSVVPIIKGQANWLVLGPIRLQPVEFIKLATLLVCARLVASPDFQPTKLLHVSAALALAAIPSLLHAKSDLGSSLTFPPMVFGMLLAMGMRLRHLLVIVFSVFFAVGGLLRAGADRRPARAPSLTRAAPHDRVARRSGRCRKRRKNA